MVKMRRGWMRLICAAAFTASIFFYISYYSRPQKPSHEDNHVQEAKPSKKVRSLIEIDLRIEGKGQGVPNRQCSAIEGARTDIDTVQQLPKFEFQPAWMRGKEFWDTNFEKRYLQRRALWPKFPLKVILMPHSHNDPGWLKTFEEYYYHKTSKILTSMVEKLQQHKNMTFVWAEVSYLAMWYERAHPKMREQLKQLLKSGRLEIVSGGWVMTDEANVHLYGMITQFIEGHQWLKDNLGLKPSNGWTIDTFGHGSTVPYLLKESGITNTVIQRIHYAWKQWLAEKQWGDFMWRQNWDHSGETDVLTHNRPYDIYSIKHSCGPHPQICLNYDFRKVFGEYTEYSIRAVNIDQKNVKERAETLLDQYGRTGSLFSHNVVLVPLGDDFRYEYSSEWDQQYKNYQKLLEWVNEHPSYHAEIKWGTLNDYFREVKKRTKTYPTLKGDFFVYSDIFTDGRPAYWSGYFSTRPYFKILGRQLEATLNAAEFLYAWSWATFAKTRHKKIAQILEKDFEKLVKARRHISLFQHHDAITGTSKSYVMHDYAIKLHEGIREASIVISHCSLALLSTEATRMKVSQRQSSMEFLQPLYERSSYEKLPKIMPIIMKEWQRVITMTNTLGQRRYEVLRIIVSSLNIKITDEFGYDVPFQVNPIWNSSSNSDFYIVENQFELFFIADLPPLSIITYTLHKTANEVNKNQTSTIYSNFYRNKNITFFQIKDVLPGDIQLESDLLKLLFDGSSGLIRSVTDKTTGRITQLTMKYAAYPSAQFKSGAYLFKPDPNAREPEEDVLAGAKPRIFIQSGPISSELTVMYGTVLIHSFRIFHVTFEPLATAIYMENSFNLGGSYNGTVTPGFSPQYRETELFFRFSTDINNGIDSRFYTDQNGLGMQERTYVERIGVQGNYYPVSSASFLEDEPNESRRRRITLLVDHATGIASLKTGYLETMIERRMFYDDSRGMGEGVTDQKRTMGKYWLLIENLQGKEEIPRLSLGAHHLSNTLNFPVIPNLLEGLESKSLKSSASFLNRPLPCSLHLLSVRTLAEPQYPGILPLNEALMVFQHQPPSCIATSAVTSCRGLGDSLPSEINFTFNVTDIRKTDLTGVSDRGRLFNFSHISVPQQRVRSFIITFP
ncbi:Alpha-mannosidase 2 [Armadillidium vulgare]|nr:Alpha-mannosidase 2 [Armadillidium vulgare]